MTWSEQKAVAGVVLVGILFLQASAWDERDLAQLREEAAGAQESGVRYLVEHSNYREALKSDYHCRPPVVGERLVMQVANAKEAGRGFRCEYFAHRKGAGDMKTTTWSRSPELVVSTREVGGAK
jgi:hypothetical protein